MKEVLLHLVVFEIVSSQVVLILRRTAVMDAEVVSV